jgi:hypothetical protein
VIGAFSGTKGDVDKVGPVEIAKGEGACVVAQTGVLSVKTRFMKRKTPTCIVGRAQLSRDHFFVNVGHVRA